MQQWQQWQTAEQVEKNKTKLSKVQWMHDTMILFIVTMNLMDWLTDTDSYSRYEPRSLFRHAAIQYAGSSINVSCSLMCTIALRRSASARARAHQTPCQLPMHKNAIMKLLNGYSPCRIEWTKTESEYNSYLVGHKYNVEAFYSQIEMWSEVAACVHPCRLSRELLNSIYAHSTSRICYNTE